jgi:hypothetical protein
VASRKGKALRPYVRERVEKGATVYTDELASYESPGSGFVHEAMNHLGTYVRVDCRSNKADSSGCLLKRAIRGTCASVEPWHPNRYLAEECFHHRQRKSNDGEGFANVLGTVRAKGLAHEALIGEVV